MKDLYLSGGSFYGIQEVFSRVKGVVDTKAGYANSSMENPTKDDVDKGLAGAVECVKVTYDPKKIDIASLLALFFTIINPYTDGIQGKYKGPQYRSGIYYTSQEDTIQISYYMAFMANKGVRHQMTDNSFVINQYEGEGGRRPPIRTEAKELINFFEAPAEEQHYLRRNLTAYTPINIQLLEQVGAIEKIQEELESE